MKLKDSIEVGIVGLDFTRREIAEAVIETAKRLKNTVNKQVTVTLPVMIDGSYPEIGYCKSYVNDKAIITVHECLDATIQNRIVSEFMIQLSGCKGNIDTPFHFE